MADCDTAVLQTGCGDSELVEVHGDTLLYRHRHRVWELRRTDKADRADNYYHNPYEVGGCYTDDREGEPGCQ